MLPSARRHHPLFRVLLGLTAAVTIVVAGIAIPGSTRAATHTVSVGDGSFAAAALTVSVGDTVTWTNDDDSPHTVTAGDGTFDSGNLEPGQQFLFTFTAPGTYAYVCAYHEEMTGTITVVEAAATVAASVAASTPAAASSAPNTPSAEQPDTALAALAGPGRGGSLPWLGAALIGLGLIAFAVGLLPAVPAGVASVRVRATQGRAGERTEGGWRR